MTGPLERLPTILESDGEGGKASWDSSGQAAPEVELLVEALNRGEAAERADQIVTKLTSGCRIDRQPILGRVVAVASTLALSEHGCRVIEAALGVVSGFERSELLTELQGSVVSLCQSKHGHQVMATVVEVMPPALVEFVIKEMVGTSVRLAQHRFASVVLDRVIIHCRESQTDELTEELIGEIDMLARHQYGSVVIQHLFEYGSPTRRARIIQHLLPLVLQLAMHRSGSNVLRRVLDYGEASDHHSIACELARASLSPVTLADIACSRSGSALLVEIADNDGCVVDDVRLRLFDVTPRLGSSKYGRRVLGRFGVALPHRFA